MRRREFTTGLASAAVWSCVARAQAAIPVVGFLAISSDIPSSPFLAGFRQGLKEAGYVEGQNVTIEFRSADGKYERVRELAADLVDRRVTVIVTVGGELSATAAKAATATIPIVFNIGHDPVKSGLVASLGQPGGNATGVNIFTTELVAKRLGLLSDLLPTASLIAVLVNPNFPPAAANAKEVEAAAGAIGKRVTILKASRDEEIDAAFVTLVQMRAEALLVAADPFFNSRRERIIAMAAKYSIPAVYEWREFALAGGLMSYGTSLVEAYRQQGIYTGRILKGEKPSGLPVVQLTKFELVINLRTAKALGLIFSPGLLAIADEVIE